MNIPFHKPHITKDEIDAVIDVLKKGWLSMEAETIQFEEAFRDKIGTRHAISVNSGTAALHLALRAIGLKQADEVIGFMGSVRISGIAMAQKAVGITKW